MGGNCPIFKEGHARRHRKKISDSYNEEKDNEEFLYKISEINIDELKSTYLWISKKLWKQPNKSLLKTK